MKRLVALVPPARLHLTSGHGVYAANAALRSVVLRQEPVPAQQPQEAPAAATRAPPKPESGGAREAEAAPEIGLGHAPGANIWGGRLEVRAMRGAPTHRGRGDESPDGRGGAPQPQACSRPAKCSHLSTDRHSSSWRCEGTLALRGLRQARGGVCR